LRNFFVFFFNCFFFFFVFLCGLTNFKTRFMKNRNLLSLGGAILICGIFFSQVQAQNTWTTPTSTVTNTGNVGIRTTDPLANLHIHGNESFIGPPGRNGQAGANLGNTSRILFSTTNTTLNTFRGFELRMSQRDMFMHNFETTGTFTLSAHNTPQILFHSSSQRLFLGRTTGMLSHTFDKRAAVNIDHNAQNGLYVRAANASNYGIFIHSRNNQDAFIIENGTGTNTTRNFKVTGEGFVFARRYTTTLNNIPDYVFAPDYRLMSFQELRDYLNTNRHLPNIPSAVEMESAPVDLGELTRLLLEKVEESTLYILQLEERIRTLESGN
jgi:hypothetical protein